uniref:G-protein coupled receptors family 1 profile domain-containing protein n=1 Tax=Loxodonta africana TaxID=9785 RepID=G3U6V5_LOXAF
HEWGKQSSVYEFLLLGLSRQPPQQQLLFMLFLSMYMATVLGNLFIILAISTDSHLHTPMYFFLSNLSFMDICFTSTTVPKMLTNPLLRSQTISFCGCLTQLYFLIVFAYVDNFLLAVMACDCFVAVCHPHYTTKMTHQLCGLLVAGLWVIAKLNGLLHTLLMAYNRIPHFFGDVSLLLKLTCSDTHLNEIMILIVRAIMIAPFIYTHISYVLIACGILRVSSTKGKWKVFPTCGSQLAVILLFYGTIIALYFNPSFFHSAETVITAIVVNPMLNPFIYSLRNKDMKGALRKMIAMKFFFCSI